MLRDHALAALEEAFADVLKREFDQLIANYSGGEKIDDALGQFTRAMHNLRTAHERAIKTVHDVFAD